MGGIDDASASSDRALGRGVDAVTGWVADGLKWAGADSAGEAVKDWGDSAASDLGAAVSEAVLGQTEQPGELIHGSQSEILATAKQLQRFQAAFERVGHGMRGLDSAHWKGRAADAFRDNFAPHSTKWLRAADACDHAAQALDRYADTVHWAQRQAREAIAQHKQDQQAAKAASGSEATHHTRAQEILDEARRQRDTAGDTAETAVRAALAHAPAEPSEFDRALATVADGATGLTVELAHVATGAVKGAAGLLSFARGLNPTDPYNQAHPAQYWQNTNTTLAGVISTAAHPERIPSSLYQSFRRDPSEGVGRLLPELIGTKGLGGARTATSLTGRESTQAAAGSARSIPSRLPHNPPPHLQAPHMPRQPPLAWPKSFPDPPTQPLSKWGHLAQPTRLPDGSPLIREKAIHYDAVPPQVARQFLDEEFPFMREVNSGRSSPELGHNYNLNCSCTTTTVDRRLDGIDVQAAPREASDYIPFDQLGDGKSLPRFRQVDSYDELIRQLAERGEGARAVVDVGVPAENGEMFKHFFNGVNTEHGVIFLDGQKGKLAELRSDAVFIGYSPYNPR